MQLGSGQDRYRAHFDTFEAAELAEVQEKQRRRNAAGPSGSPSGAPLRPSELAKQGKTLQHAYDLTMRLHWAGEKAEKTHRINAGQVVEHLGPDTLLTELKNEDIPEMIFEFEDRGNTGATINKKLSSLSMILKTAIDQGWLTKMPFKIPRRKESKHRIRWMDEEEEARVLQLCEHIGYSDLRDYIVVAIDTGFRRGELLGFTSKDFSGGLLHLHAGSTKTDAARSVPATARVKAILDARAPLTKPFERLPKHILRAQWDRVRGLMGLEEDGQFIVHMLRHTCASRMVQRRVPLAVVQHWMGHKRIETTLRYAHLAPDSLLQAKAALEMPARQPEITDF